MTDFPSSPESESAMAGISRRLEDVIVMINSPGEYSRVYVAGACRVILGLIESLGHAPTPAVPIDITGWKLVPDDATEAMWQAGRSADIHPGDSYAKVWRAMFNAAPTVDDCETVTSTKVQPHD